MNWIDFIPAIIVLICIWGMGFATGAGWMHRKWVKRHYDYLERDRRNG